MFRADFESQVGGIAALNEPTSPPSSAPGLAREARSGTAGSGLCTEDPRSTASSHGQGLAVG